MLRIPINSFVRFQSTAVPGRLFNVVESPQKIKEEQKIQISEDVPKVSPKPNPPIFEYVNGFQTIHPYEKIQYLTIEKLKKKKQTTILKFLDGSFIGQNIDFLKKQILDKKLWLLRRTAPFHKGELKNRRNINVNDPSKYELFNGRVLFEKILKKEDVIANYSCVHEIAIPELKNIDIIYEDKDLVVVNKPSGVPVHPSGNAYKFNTLQYYLALRQAEIEGGSKESIIDKETLEFHTNIHPCHRIDKDTSGVIIFAKNTTKGGSIAREIEEKKGVIKRYVALVHGDFGKKQRISKQPVVGVDVCKRYESGGKCYKVEYGKTHFIPIHYDSVSNTTLIQADLYTGRKHQIRQHLRNLGYHIVNDPLYGKEGILNQPMYHPPSKQVFNAMRQKYEVQLQHRVDKWEKQSLCTNCGHVTYKNPVDEVDKYMRLHALQYSFQPKDKPQVKWSFMAPLPWWARILLSPARVAEMENGGLKLLSPKGGDVEVHEVQKGKKPEKGTR